MTVTLLQQIKFYDNYVSGRSARKVYAVANEAWVTFLSAVTKGNEIRSFTGLTFGIAISQVNDRCTYILLIILCFGLTL